MSVIGWIASVDPVLGTALTVLAICVILGPFAKRWFCRKRSLNKKLDAGMDSILGYGPVLDPASGAVLKEATPSMAVRVDTIEQAILALAETHRQLTEINNRLTHMEEWREHHMAWSESQHPTIVQNITTEPKISSKEK